MAKSTAASINTTSSIVGRSTSDSGPMRRAGRTRPGPADLPISADGGLVVASVFEESITGSPAFGVARAE